MKKILFGLVGILLTAGLVGGSAYALFTSTAQVKGLKITSGNANLQVALDNAGYNSVSSPFGTGFASEQTFGNGLNAYLFGNVFPGYQNYGYFRLKNASSSNIPLELAGKLKDGATGNWNGLKDKVQFLVTDVNGNSITGWQTLASWNAGYIFLGSIPYNTTQTYRIYVKVLGTAGDEIANMTLDNIQFDIVGTQIQ